MKQRCTSAGAGNRISSNKRLGSGSENLPRVTQLGHCIRTPILEYLVVLHCSLLVVAIAFQLISKKEDTYPNASADHRRKDEWAAARATGEGIFEAAGCDVQTPRADVTVAAKRRRGSRLFHPRLRLPSSTQHLHSTGSKMAIDGPYARPAELPSVDAAYAARFPEVQVMRAADCRSQHERGKGVGRGGSKVGLL